MAREEEVRADRGSRAGNKAEPDPSSLAEKLYSTLIFQALFCRLCNRFLPSLDPLCSSVFIVPSSLNRPVEVWVQEGVLGISSEMQPLETAV